jgi:hypothetical protein
MTAPEGLNRQGAKSGKDRLTASMKVFDGSARFWGFGAGCMH